VSIHIDVDNGFKINIIIIKQNVIMGIVQKYHSDHLYAKFDDVNAYKIKQYVFHSFFTSVNI
jgi:hypothetical protein